MKNIFKFMGIALMACSFTMVACSKDDDKKTDTPDVNIDAAIAVTFDEQVWTSDVPMEYNADHSYFDVYEEGEDLATMQFACGLQKGAYGFAGTDYYVKYWAGDIEYDTPSNDGTIVITDIDVNAKTMTGVISAVMIKDGAQHPLSAVLTNAKWE